MCVYTWNTNQITVQFISCIVCYIMMAAPCEVTTDHSIIVPKNAASNACVQHASIDLAQDIPL